MDHMAILITGHYRSAKDNARLRAKSKTYTGSQSSSDEDNGQFALPPPHSSTSSSGSSMRSTPMPPEDVPHAHYYSSAGEYFAFSSNGSGERFFDSGIWRKEKYVMLLVLCNILMLKVSSFCEHIYKKQYSKCHICRMTCFVCSFSQSLNI